MPSILVVMKNLNSLVNCSPGGKGSSMRYRCVPRRKVFGGLVNIKRGTAGFCLEPSVSSLLVRLLSARTPVGANILGQQLFFSICVLWLVAKWDGVSMNVSDPFLRLQQTRRGMKPSWGCELCNGSTRLFFYIYFTLSRVLLVLLLIKRFMCIYFFHFFSHCLFSIYPHWIEWFTLYV